MSKSFEDLMTCYNCGESEFAEGDDRTCSECGHPSLLTVQEAMDIVNDMHLKGHYKPETDDYEELDFERA